MANANISQVTVTNTFDDWRVATNALIVDRNILRNYPYVKDTSDFIVANGTIQVTKSTLGTVLIATGNVTVSDKISTSNISVSAVANVNIANVYSASAGGGTLDVSGNTSLWANLSVSKNTTISQNSLSDRGDPGHETSVIYRNREVCSRLGK